ncbi:MAG: NAD(P)/FAD-dependent oxidoreductase [Johnsonella sp.]|nr:NAD(P)/FAD-dependent oxidoreductase [Johnsonella sp.]
MSEVLIIGAGAAGLIAAISAAAGGHRVRMYEKNEKIGKKLFITGKGRCNLTNASDMKTVMEHVVSNPKFLYSAFQAFTNEDIMRMVEDAGCPLCIERGNRVFPVSGHSSDVLKAFRKLLDEYGVELYLNTEVGGLLIEGGSCIGIELKKGGEKIRGDAVIVATGGLSYRGTGSTGDGYRFAKEAGHRICHCSPSLVPFNIEEPEAAGLQGLSLRNIRASVFCGEKEIFSDFGELLFTHFGVSGPLILSASAYAGRILQEKKLRLRIDLKPALDDKQLDERILRDFSKYRNKRLKNALADLLPSKLIPEVIRQSGAEEDEEVYQISREERSALLRSLKQLEFTISSTRGFNEAVITKGGIEIKEINPSTMESRLVKNLYFAGEVLDLDALTGGYNLQIAWSTGWCAGANIDYV